jgi:cyclopropane-fatty-acyl-phospholipid synthase
VEGEIDLEGSLRDVLRLGEALVSDRPSAYGKRAPRWRWWTHSRASDRRNVQRHYDVGNDFYALWLDRNRVYSCAYFRTPEDSLDQAQEQKLDHICRKLMLKPDERLLDIGCGWGGLMLWAARHYGTRTLGITLSEGQHRYVQERIRELKLEDRCEVRLLDYRDVPEDEPFDKIASVGMFEHVGRHNLPLYFGKIQRLLRPGGLVMNHGITTNSLEGAQLGSGIGEFVSDYVFPGGELMHVSTVLREMARQGLETFDAECLRPHYARTLWHWVDRLEAQRDAARALVGERKLRVWLIYMAGSAHAFARGWISVYQLLGGRPLADGSLPHPLTREHLYLL